MYGVVLTGLRNLRLRGSCFCHGGDEGDCFVEPLGWRATKCEFDAFEGQGGFLWLLTLTGLKVLEASGPWEVLEGSFLRAAVDAVRRVAGRPPLKFLKFD